MRGRCSVGLVCAAVALLLASCTGQSSTTSDSVSPSPGTSSVEELLATTGSGSTASSESPPAVEHVEPEGMTVLDTQDEMTGSASLGSFPVTKDVAWIYLTCWGSGPIRINIDVVGSFPLECDETATTSINQFQVTGNGQFSVDIEAQPGQVWAVTVAQEP